MAITRVVTIDDAVALKTALVSVYDKHGLDSFVRALLAATPGLRILSTGGTYASLAAALGDSARSSLRQVSDYTGQPEMQGGLVKTLDYKLYLGLLSETHNPSHRADLARAGADPIDLVVVNLYPFAQAAARPGSDAEDARGNIDIGGPCMVRAAAKNFHRVAVLTDPADYPAVLDELGAHGGRLGLATRFRLACKAFEMIAAYDGEIARWMGAASFDVVAGAYSVRRT